MVAAKKASFGNIPRPDAVGRLQEVVDRQPHELGIACGGVAVELHLFRYSLLMASEAVGVDHLGQDLLAHVGSAGVVVAGDHMGSGCF